MNTYTNYIIFALLSITTLMSITNMFSNNIFAQPVVKEILIGPDSSKDGDDIYNPNDITIEKGNKVKWINTDFGIHTVTENQGLFSSKDLRPNETFEYKFETIGIYDYHCKLHPDMVGKITVN
jgi:plastocyanin